MLTLLSEVLRHWVSGVPDRDEITSFPVSLDALDKSSMNEEDGYDSINSYINRIAPDMNC